MTQKKIDIGSIILNLFKQKQEISIHDVAQAAGMSCDKSSIRRAIQRAFKNLIENKIIQTKGNARTRVYILTNPITKIEPKIENGTIQPESMFKDISLSNSSTKLLRYLTKPVHARAPAGYHQDFLKSYQPNKSSYLTEQQKSKLIAIGRAESIVRPAGTYARNIFNRLLIDISWNSSRLEGNTYSLLETKRLIELGESATGKNAIEAQMILNHKGAIEYILDSINDDSITSHTVCSLHALLSENLLGNPAASGRLRQITIAIAKSTYLPLDNPHVLKECFDIWLEKVNQIKDPFEQSFFSLIHLSYMQAFEDVNKRTARLVANIPLIKQNLKPLSFTDIPKEAYVTALLGVYEKNDISLCRDLFVWAYHRSSQKYSAIQESLGEPNLLKLKYRDSIHEIIRSIMLEKIDGKNVVSRINILIKALNLSEHESTQLFQIIEIEIMSLHDGNIARFKIRPSEFQEWKKLQ